MRRSLSHQRGVAVVTALLLTTLAISIVASLFWQQQVQVRSMENQRLHLQTKWIQRGALDWASVILRQSYGNYISLDQIWATPLEETRLDQYIERERVQGENYDATLSGQVLDATARYNLNNLARSGIPDPVEVKVLERLLSNARLESRLAKVIANFVAAGQPLAPPDPEKPPPSTTAPRIGTPMHLLRVDDLLAVPGMTPESVERLRPFVIVLPGDEMTVNVNTAPAEVLAAVVPDVSLSKATAMVDQRKRIPWADLAKFKVEMNGGPELDEARIDVKSQFFLVRSRIRLDRAALDTESLVQKTSGGREVKILWTRQN